MKHKHDKHNSANSANSAAQKERNAKYIADALFKSKFKPEDPSEETRLLEKAMDVATKVRKTVKPILAAGGWKDTAAIRHLILTLYLEVFDTRTLFTHDDLVQVCAVIHTDLMMETIEKDPTLSGTPDLLS